jgi:hypothetical protein
MPTAPGFSHGNQSLTTAGGSRKLHNPHCCPARTNAQLKLHTWQGVNNRMDSATVVHHGQQRINKGGDQVVPDACIFLYLSALPPESPPCCFPSLATSSEVFKRPCTLLFCAWGRALAAVSATSLHNVCTQI